MVRVEGGTGDVDSNYESLRSSLHRSPPIAAVIRPDDLLQVGLEGVEQAQHGVGGVPAGVAGGSDIVVDPAGEWPDAVDRAGPAGEVEEGAEAAVILPLRQQVEELLFAGEDCFPEKC